MTVLNLFKGFLVAFPLLRLFLFSTHIYPPGMVLLFKMPLVSHKEGLQSVLTCGIKHENMNY